MLKVLLDPLLASFMLLWEKVRIAILAKRLCVVVEITLFANRLPQGRRVHEAGPQATEPVNDFCDAGLVEPERRRNEAEVADGPNVGGAHEAAREAARGVP